MAQFTKPIASATLAAKPVSNDNWRVAGCAAKPLKRSKTGLSAIPYYSLYRHIHDFLVGIEQLIAHLGHSCELKTRLLCGNHDLC